jgi:hypothetical protein
MINVTTRSCIVRQTRFVKHKRVNKFHRCKTESLMRSVELPRGIQKVHTYSVYTTLLSLCHLLNSTPLGSGRRKMSSTDIYLSPLNRLHLISNKGHQNQIIGSVSATGNALAFAVFCAVSTSPGLQKLLSQCGVLCVQDQQDYYGT